MDLPSDSTRQIKTNFIDWKDHSYLYKQPNKYYVSDFLSFLRLNDKHCKDCDKDYALCDCEFCENCNCNRCVCDYDVEDLIIWICSNFKKEDISKMLNSTFKTLVSHWYMFIKNYSPSNHDMYKKVMIYFYTFQKNLIIFENCLENKKH